MSGELYVIANSTGGRVARNGLGQVILFPGREQAETALAQLLGESEDWARFGVFSTYLEEGTL